MNPNNPQHASNSGSTTRSRANCEAPGCGELAIVGGYLCTFHFRERHRLFATLKILSRLRRALTRSPVVDLVQLQNLEMGRFLLPVTPNFSGKILLRPLVSFTEFHHINFGGSEIVGGTVTKSSFRKCNLERSLWSQTRFLESKLVACRLSGARFRECQFTNTKISWEDLQGSSFEEMSFSISSFGTSPCTLLSGMSLMDVNISDIGRVWPVTLDGCILKSVTFRSCELQRIRVKRTNRIVGELIVDNSDYTVVRNEDIAAAFEGDLADQVKIVNPTPMKLEVATSRAIPDQDSPESLAKIDSAVCVGRARSDPTFGDPSLPVPESENDGSGASLFDGWDDDYDLNRSLLEEYPPRDAVDRLPTFGREFGLDTNRIAVFLTNWVPKLDKFRLQLKRWEPSGHSSVSEHRSLGSIFGRMRHVLAMWFRGCLQTSRQMILLAWIAAAFLAVVSSSAGTILLLIILSASDAITSDKWPSPLVLWCSQVVLAMTLLGYVLSTKLRSLRQGMLLR